MLHAADKPCSARVVGFVESAKVEELKRVPRPRNRQAHFGSGDLQRWIYRMIPYSAKPVFRIGVVLLAPMHERVPVTAFDRLQLLAHGMGFIEEIVVKPERSEEEHTSELQSRG